MVGEPRGKRLAHCMGQFPRQSEPRNVSPEPRVPERHVAVMRPLLTITTAEAGFSKGSG